MAARTQTIATGTSLVAARFHGLKGCEAKRSSVGVCGSKLRAGSMVVVRAAHEASVDVKENSVSAGILPSGEWSENFSLLNYEDLTKYYEPKLFKPEAQPDTILAEVMSKLMYIAFPDQSLEEVDCHFAEISGLPVVDTDHRCVGVLSKTDRSKASDLKTKVKEVMSSPAITLSADRTVSDAAVLMLKHKIHRIPVINSQAQVVGIVTRTDIFTALEGGV